MREEKQCLFQINNVVAEVVARGGASCLSLRELNPQSLKGSPMEKLSRPWDKEHMRMAMLEQEETFKEQVYELHRLYRIQKILMKNIEASRAIGVSQLGWDFKNAIGLTQNDHHKGTQEKPTMKFNLEGLDLEDMTESDSGRVLNIINEREIELTLGPSRYSHKNNQTPLTIDSGHIWSSSSAGSNLINKTICRNHHRTYTTREELSGGIIGLAQVPESTSGYKSGMRNSYDIEEQSRQGRSEQSPWLLQVLSLKMT